MLTIKLEVTKDLEPKWYVVNSRLETPISISANDRALLNTHIISDYIDRHFSWSKGGPLYSLLKQNNNQGIKEDDNTIMEALRDAKKKIDQIPFSQFDIATQKIKLMASELGVNISKTSTTIDYKDISFKDGKVCLHDENIPYRLKGKGTKRLLSIAIQSAIIDDGGIILIDEIEQGLEPDRVQHLVHTLKSQNKGQVFITTHSRDVLVELTYSDIFLMKSKSNNLISFDKNLQGCLRANPEAFFAERVIVCEGATEMGICRALNSFRVKKGKLNAAFKGVRMTNGGGNQLVNYSEGFISAGYNTLVFCDSDSTELNLKKEGLKKMGIQIVDWDNGDYLEVAIVKGLPFKAIEELLILAANIMTDETSNTIEICKVSIWDSVKAKFGSEAPEKFEKQADSIKLRIAIGQAANKNSWFKSQSKGEALGSLIFKYYDQIDEKFKSQLDAISNWIDNGKL